ncbi:elongation factor P hydroxylase [Aliagarivorans taiwanensis]|uniref:elongation factor P hydroxylase n=1 Tax=Aliagarivorans taiwanensis TaxID=561966 RepID=UPI000416C909|nr:elongation factor P hydroxylase [Aliagarivorans taiwanensis]
MFDDIEQLISLFNHCFNDYQTVLVAGGEEPLYVPASATQPAKIIFRDEYFNSALHEIAHWCIAGPARRKLEDYGYWYCPDGRDAEKQAEFEQVEVKPQAIEMAFALACGRPFRVSVDNLYGDAGDSAQFQKRVSAQHHLYLQHGFPQRANLFIDAIEQHLTQSRQPESLQHDA